METQNNSNFGALKLEGAVEKAFYDRLTAREKQFICSFHTEHDAEVGKFAIAEGISALKAREMIDRIQERVFGEVAELLRREGELIFLEQLVGSRLEKSHIVEVVLRSLFRGGNEPAVNIIEVLLAEASTLGFQQAASALPQQG